MPFSDGFGILRFYGLMLEQFVVLPGFALHWSIQPGVSDGCLELFTTRDAAKEHMEVVSRPWLGLAGPRLAMVQLHIRADRLYTFLQHRVMKLDGGKLRVFEQLKSGVELYSLFLDDGSVPAMPLPSVPPVHSPVEGTTPWRLHGMFLKACVDCVDWKESGIHWTMQPGGYGRITLHADPAKASDKHAYYQTSVIGAGPAAPETVRVVLDISMQAASRIMSEGALVKGHRAGVFYMYVNVYGEAYFDAQRQELVYTASVITV